ncbi:hypothetical protein [Phenylobacterium sp.]|uniref:hypothetical protein n=1 Tax=Phenylobacterium sp. TaxID=1871053 RepID=UPI0035675C4A
MPGDPKPAPALGVDPTSVARWWLPGWPQVLGAGLYAMAFWLLWTLSPAKGAEPSELFNMLAQAIVLNGFIGGVVAAVFAMSRSSSSKIETGATPAPLVDGEATDA